MLDVVNGISDLLGLAGLVRTEFLTLDKTAMRNMKSFGALRCSTVFVVYGSPELQSLEGLENMQVIPGNTPYLSLDVRSSPMTAAGLAPLRLFAACSSDNTSLWTDRPYSTLFAETPCAPAVSPWLPRILPGLKWLGMPPRA